MEAQFGRRAPIKMVPAPHFSTPLPCALLPGTRRATPHLHGPPTRIALRPPHRSGTRATGRRGSTAARAAQRSQPSSSSSSLAAGRERRRGSPWRASCELAHGGLGRFGSRGPSARHAGCTLHSMALALHCTLQLVRLCHGTHSHAPGSEEHVPCTAPPGAVLSCSSFRPDLLT